MTATRTLFTTNAILSDDGPRAIKSPSWTANNGWMVLFFIRISKRPGAAFLFGLFSLLLSVSYCSVPMFKQYSQILSSHKRRKSKGSAIQVLSSAQSDPASETQTVNEPVETWAHSQPLDLEGQQNDCFTTLTPRIHKYDHVAQRGSDRFIEDLNAALGSDSEKRKESYLTSTVGNYSSFLYPECAPEKLELVAYLTELANFHDGMLRP